MYARLAVAAVAALIGLGGNARAEQPSVAQTVRYGGGPAYGGFAVTGGALVACRVFNFGATAVTISVRQIFANTGDPVTINSDTCNVSLLPGKSCAYASQYSTSQLAYSCRLVARSTAVNISGVVEIQSLHGDILAALPLTK